MIDRVIVTTLTSTNPIYGTNASLTAAHVVWLVPMVPGKFCPTQPFKTQRLTDLPLIG